MKPLVSIIIPAYNAAETTAQTIHSAISQTWPNKEVIVIDDGSRDGTGQVARQFASKSVVLVSQGNQGQCAAVNRGIRSQGDFIHELDADDILVHDKNERQLAALKAYDKSPMLSSLPFLYYS
jgi:glycosyltransferase involved in cell wall biosynthesis